jgi:flagellin
MTISVNTNTAAMNALQYLNKTSASIGKTETAVSTGYTVNSARDNGALYAIAQNMRSNISGYSAVETSLNNGLSALDTAISGGESVSDLLNQLKETALSASDTSINTASRQAYNEDFQALVSQIGSVVSNASFNGLNLLNGSTKKIMALSTSSGNKITVQVKSFSFKNASVMGVGFSSGLSITTAASASKAASLIAAAVKNVNSTLAKMSAGAKKFSIQLGFVSSLSDSLSSGVGNLVDADMSKESALLTSLQTKQQLGVQALSIANSSSAIALSLFS